MGAPLAVTPPKEAAAGDALAALAVASSLPTVASQPDPAAFVISKCREASDWLATPHTPAELPVLADCRRRAHDVTKTVSRLRLGSQARSAASEALRRAERAAGTMIRAGQADGTVETVEQARARAGRAGMIAKGQHPAPLKARLKIADFVPHDQLYCNGYGVLALTDGVTDAQFEDALAAAIADGMLTRRHVIRKIAEAAAPAGPQAGAIPSPMDRGTAAVAWRRRKIRELAGTMHDSRQIGEATGLEPATVRRLARSMKVEIGADEFTLRSRALDSSRILRETVTILEGTAFGVSMIDITALDADEITSAVVSLSASLKTLTKLSKSLREAAR